MEQLLHDVALAKASNIDIINDVIECFFNDFFLSSHNTTSQLREVLLKKEQLLQYISLVQYNKLLISVSHGNLIGRNSNNIHKPLRNVVNYPVTPPVLDGRPNIPVNVHVGTPGTSSTIVSAISDTTRTYRKWESTSDPVYTKKQKDQ